jgi:hypothetical protein
MDAWLIESKFPANQFSIRQVIYYKAYGVAATFKQLVFMKVFWKMYLVIFDVLHEFVYGFFL